MALNDTTEALKKSNEHLANIRDVLVEERKDNNANKLAEKEERKEEKSRMEKLFGMLVKKQNNTAKKALKLREKSQFGFMKKLLLWFAIADITVFVYEKLIKVKRLFTLMGKAVVGMFKLAGKVLNLISKGRFTEAWNMVVKAITGTFAKIGKSFKSTKIGKTITDVFSKIGKSFRSIVGKVKTGPIKKFFGTFVKWVKRLRFLFKPLRLMIRLLAWPITIIIAIVEGIRGFIKEYKENGSILDGIRGALIGIVDGLVGWILDLGAWAVGWMLEKMGVDTEITDVFKNFDFGEWANNFVESATEWLTNTFANIYLWFQENVIDPWNAFDAEKMYAKIKEKADPFFKFFEDLPNMIGDLFNMLFNKFEKIVPGGDKILKALGLRDEAVNGAGSKSISDLAAWRASDAGRQYRARERLKEANAAERKTRRAEELSSAARMNKLGERGNMIVYNNSSVSAPSSVSINSRDPGTAVQRAVEKTSGSWDK